MKRQITEWEKLVVNHKSEKEPVTGYRGKAHRPAYC